MCKGGLFMKKPCASLINQARQQGAQSYPLSRTCQLQNQLRRAKKEASTRGHKERLRRTAAAMKAEANQQDLRDSLVGVNPSHPDAVREFAEACNVRLFDLDPAQRSWMRLYRRVDADSSGLISFAEFTGLVRTELALAEADSEGGVREADLGGAWGGAVAGGLGGMPSPVSAKSQLKLREAQAELGRLREEYAALQSEHATLLDEHEEVSAERAKLLHASRTLDAEMMSALAQRDATKQQADAAVARAIATMKGAVEKARSDAAREIAEAKADADAAREELKDVKASFHDTLQVVLAGDGPSSSTAPATSRPTFALEEEEED